MVHRAPEKLLDIKLVHLPILKDRCLGNLGDWETEDNPRTDVIRYLKLSRVALLGICLILMKMVLVLKSTE